MLRKTIDVRYPPPLPSDVPIMYGEEYYVGASTRCPVVYDISIEIEYTSCCAEYHRSSNNMGGVNTIQNNGNYSSNHQNPHSIKL